MTEINSPEVNLDLGGETLTLKCTLGAAQKISRHFGGLYPASQQVMSLSLEALVAVIRHGAGLTDAETKSLPEKVFQAGIGDVAAKAVIFLGYLNNGGRVEAPKSKGEA